MPWILYNNHYIMCDDYITWFHLDYLAFSNVRVDYIHVPIRTNHLQLTGFGDTIVIQLTYCESVVSGVVNGVVSSRGRIGIIKLDFRSF